ncbi:50S ribosomal protein L32 [bacterium]
MPNPKRRHSKSRRDKRRANWKLEDVQSVKCPQCGDNVLPHKVCASCGYYKDETVIIVKQTKKKENNEE